MRDSRLGRWIACCTAFALLCPWLTVTPAGAQAQSETPEAAAAITIMEHSCSLSAREFKATLPGVKAMLARAGHRSVLLAQNEAEPSPAPTASPEPYETVFPAVTPFPSPSATQGLPPLQRTPIGPGVLPPPTVPPATATPGPPGTPTPSPSPSVTPQGPIPVVRPTGPPPTVTPVVAATATPFPTTSPSPTPGPTIAPLQPGQVLIISDKYKGSSREDEPQDFDGNVNLFYDQGVIVADHAHYDGKRYMDFTGSPYLRNYAGNTVLRSEIIRFDRVTQQATLLKGAGETSEGVEKGLLYFKAADMKSLRSGYTVGNNAFWTTCQNPHAGYHMEAKNFELRPNDKLIARKVTVYLGPLAVFYIPVLVVSLASRHLPRQSSFLPLVGYDQTEGFWIKTRFGFGSTQYFAGYYRVEYFTKLGLGFGINFTVGTRNHRRVTSVDFYRSPPKPSGGSNNFTLNDQEILSYHMKSQEQIQYISNYGPFVTGQPPALTLGGSLSYTGSRATEQVTFQHYSQGSQQGSMNLGYTETVNFRSNITDALNVGMTRNFNSFAGQSTSVGSTHLQDLFNYTTPWALYSLNFDKTLSQTPTGTDIEPEFSLQPRALFPNERVVPVTMQFLFGQYTVPQQPFSATRGLLSMNFGPAVAHFWNSDLSATLRVQQYEYSTGDLKATINQQLTFTTPFGNHVLNAITYNEANSNGPTTEPFQTFDVIGGNTHGAQDVVQFYNKNVWVLRLADGTSFNRQAQPVSYSLTTRPSLRSYLSVAGSWVPGAGNGFEQTQYQWITPFGYKTDLQFAATENWKERGKITDKVVYLRRIIGDCYDVRIAYNQDLKMVSVGFDLLAFPSYGVNFGLGQVGSIVPGNLTGAF
ncbi:MAG: hypothetical protein ACRENA_10545 [Vulcanimicrobiaceae bacterium]